MILFGFDHSQMLKEAVDIKQEVGQICRQQPDWMAIFTDAYIPASYIADERKDFGL